MARQHAEQSSGDGRDGAENSLRVARAVEKMPHEKLAVQPRRQVLIGIHERNVAARDAEARHRNESQQRPVSEEADSDGDDLSAAV